MDKVKRGRKKTTGKRYICCFENDIAEDFERHIKRKGVSAQTVLRDVVNTYLYIDGNVREDTVTIRVTNDFYDKIKTMSESKGLSIDDYIRGILRSVL